MMRTSIGKHEPNLTKSVIGREFYASTYLALLIKVISGIGCGGADSDLSKNGQISGLWASCE